MPLVTAHLFRSIRDRGPQFSLDASLKTRTFNANGLRRQLPNTENCTIERGQGHAINVVRRRIPVAVPTPGRARRAVAGLFGPRRVHPRTVATLRYRPGWCRSPDARAAWRLRSDSRQTHP